MEKWPGAKPRAYDPARQDERGANTSPKAQDSSETIRGYELTRTLGQGEFGKVYEARLGEAEYAIKQIKLKSSRRSNWLAFRSLHSVGRLRAVGEEGAAAELEPLLALSSLKHKHLVRFYQAFISRKSMWIVLELCPLGDMDGFVLSDEYDRALDLSIMRQVAAGIAFLHENGIVHRDVKPANILFTGRPWCPEAKIADFGLSKLYTAVTGGGAGGLVSGKGTPCFVAPEVVQPPYTEKCDVFSMGVVFASLIDLTTVARGNLGLLIKGEPIFEALIENPELNLYRRLMTSLPSGSPLKDMCLAMLAYTPEDRPSATHVREVLLQTRHQESQHAPRRQESSDVGARADVLGTVLTLRHLELTDKTEQGSSDDLTQTKERCYSDQMSSDERHHSDVSDDVDISDDDDVEYEHDEIKCRLL
ncbi:STK35 [Branchiostoma lanceolatum]|uniref:STK35 protein n=1 Tax=Branchiostoma lanceolatum TaxID=7740 RepID=A0A8J9ZE75_BRALA|nr:STK35 [Branchiostoma lanceolatum]